MKMPNFSLFLGGIVGLCSLLYIPRLQAETPYITIESPIIGTLFEVQSEVTLSGKATPDSEITLATKDGEYASLSSSNDGTWSYTIPTVSEGSHTLIATVKVPIDSLSAMTASANVTYVVSSEPKTSTTVTRLAETGIVPGLSIALGVAIVSFVGFSFIDYRKHRKPLIEADPSAKYTFWHHLHVVSLPVIRYRLSISVDRRLPSRSDQVRRY